MAREVRLWEWMREGLRATEGLHMRRVENRVSAGDPDVDGCYRGRYFEVELKGCDRPKTPGGNLDDFEVRPSQVVWHRKRTRCGGNNWLYVRVGTGREVSRYLIPGAKAAQVKGKQEEGALTEAYLSGLAVLPPYHTVGEFLARVTA